MSGAVITVTCPHCHTRWQATGPGGLDCCMARLQDHKPCREHIHAAVQDAFAATPDRDYAAELTEAQVRG